MTTFTDNDDDQGPYVPLSDALARAAEEQAVEISNKSDPIAEASAEIARDSLTLDSCPDQTMPDLPIRSFLRKALSDRTEGGLRSLILALVHEAEDADFDRYMYHLSSESPLPSEQADLLRAFVELVISRTTSILKEQEVGLAVLGATPGLSNHAMTQVYEAQLQVLRSILLYHIIVRQSLEVPTSSGWPFSSCTLL